MTERPPFFDMAGVSALLGIIVGSAVGGAVGLSLGPDWMVLVTAIGIVIGVGLGILGERRAALRRAASAPPDSAPHR